jgi:septal ring factor EnvC (AmiA/AmiB activator)
MENYIEQLQNTIVDHTKTIGKLRTEIAHLKWNNERLENKITYLNETAIAKRKHKQEVHTAKLMKYVNTLEKLLTENNVKFIKFDNY